MERNEFTNANEALSFLLGGNATMTFQSEKTGARYTFKHTVSDDKKLRFVSVLSGPDNTSDYTYVGILVESVSGDDLKLGVKLTRKSAFATDSTPVKAHRYVVDALQAGQMPKGVSVWHEGRCGRCGRVLTVPTSLSSGFGPECVKKMGVAA
jgi:hypothetical protein